MQFLHTKSALETVKEKDGFGRSALIYMSINPPIFKVIPESLPQNISLVIERGIKILGRNF
jgi:hypothetical protein